MKKAFECKMCGHCCEGLGGIVLTVRDLARIARHMQISEAEFCDLYGESRGHKLIIRSGEDGFCIFYRAGLGCAVHLGRPDICRAWPFFKGNLGDPVSLEMASSDCPGINREVAFEEFARQGLEYLRENDLLVDDDDKKGPNALKLKKS